MANYHMASCRNPDVPLDAEKFLFCVDLVKFVISARWPDNESVAYNINGCEEYRDSIYNAFTGDIKKAVEVYTERFRESVENKFTEYVRNNEEVSSESFEKYASAYEKEFSLKDEINYRNLMKFFVTLALASGHYFYNGVEKAPEIAGNLIYLKLPQEQFLNSDFWDKLNKACCEILGIREEEVAEPLPSNLIDYQEH